MKLAAIDIGSNAIRIQIVKVFEQDNMVSFKKLEFLRFPLRLGKDVFKKKKISDPVLDKFSKLMQTFRLLIDLYEVDAYYAVATSAMREAENGILIKHIINQTANIDIHIISGIEEADILNKAITPYLENGQNIHIDVGGGSTELNLYQGKKLIDSKSLKMGSVRKLSKKDIDKNFRDITSWIKKSKFNSKENIIGIGTGGNINKLSKLAFHSDAQNISLVALKAIRAYVNAYSVEQRMSILKMNTDRADVIIPAADIYIRSLEAAGADNILVPKVGLKDGIIYNLYEQTSKRKLEELEYL